MGHPNRSASFLGNELARVCNIRHSFQAEKGRRRNDSLLPSCLHSCIANLHRRFSSATSGSLLISVGVKNLRWQLSHVANMGVLPSYRRIVRRRSVIKPAFPSVWGADALVGSHRALAKNSTYTNTDKTHATTTIEIFFHIGMSVLPSVSKARVPRSHPKNAADRALGARDYAHSVRSSSFVICHNVPMYGRYRLSRRKQLIEE